MSSSLAVGDANSRRPLAVTLSTSAGLAAGGGRGGANYAANRKPSVSFSECHSAVYLVPPLGSVLQAPSPLATPMRLAPVNSWPLTSDESNNRLSFVGSTDYSQDLMSVDVDNYSYLGDRRQSDGRLISAVRSKELRKSVKDKRGKDAQQQPRHHVSLLSDQETLIVEAYYYHWIFAIARLLAFLNNLTALILIVLSLSVPIWVEIPHKVEPNGPEYLYQLTMFNNGTVLLHKAQKRSFLADIRRNIASGIKVAIDRGTSALAMDRGASSVVTAIDGSVNSNSDLTINNRDTAFTALMGTEVTEATSTDAEQSSTPSEFEEPTFEPYSFGATIIEEGAQR